MSGFHASSVSTILSYVPKQRQTGLFSATQAKEIEELLNFGIRNPIRMVVTSDNKLKIAENLNEKVLSGEATPQKLENYYTASFPSLSVIVV